MLRVIGRGLTARGDNQRVRSTSLPQALKRGSIFSDLTAQLKSCPSQSQLDPSFATGSRALFKQSCTRVVTGTRTFGNDVKYGGRPRPAFARKLRKRGGP